MNQIDWSEAGADDRRKFHGPEPSAVKRLLTYLYWPIYRARRDEEFRRRYPDGITDEQRRRIRDLHDPFGEYAPDDPRKYNIYDAGRDGYKPKPGQAPYRIRPHQLPTDNLSPYEVFRWNPRITREEFRRFVDLGDHRDVYDRDDPRRYGVYGRGTFGYEPSPGDKPSDGRVLRFWDEDSQSERVVDTTSLTNGQFRRLIDLGDPHAEYADDDLRAYGGYERGTRGAQVRPEKLFFWKDTP